MKLISRGGSALMLLFVLTQVTNALLIQIQADRQMGFASATSGGEGGEFLVLKDVQNESVMANAGFATGDTPRFDIVDTFYRLHIDDRGTTVVVPVRRGEDLSHYPLRVPGMEVKYRRISVIY